MFRPGSRKFVCATNFYNFSSIRQKPKTTMSEYTRTYTKRLQKWDKTTQTLENDSNWNPPDCRKLSIRYDKIYYDKRSDSVRLSSNSERGPRDGNSNDDKEKRKKIVKEIGWFALKAAGISAVTLGGIAIAVPALGFGAAGVTVGSLAAAYQSAFLGGTIASGSAFAILQSVGAAGLAASTQVGIIAGSAAVSAGTSVRKVLKKNKAGENTKEAKKEDSKNLSNETRIKSQIGFKKDAATQTDSEKNKADENEKEAIKEDSKNLSNEPCVRSQTGFKKDAATQTDPDKDKPDEKDAATQTDLDTDFDPENSKPEVRKNM